MGTTHTSVFVENSTNVRAVTPEHGKDLNDRQVSFKVLTKAVEELLNFDKFDIVITSGDIEADLNYGRG